MKTVIAGSHWISDAGLVERAIAEAAERGMHPSLVLIGGQRPVDQAARAWAEKRGIEVRLIEANTKGFGIVAYPKRNGELVRDADAVIALWDGASFDTGNLITIAQRHGIAVYVHQVDPLGGQESEDAFMDRALEGGARQEVKRSQRRRRLK
jgi:hypothetical protein